MRLNSTVHPRDLFANFGLVVLIFWLPILAIAVTGYIDVGTSVRTAVWTASCLIMAVASLLNAMRCGRLQCYLTGPFFLVGAIASLLHGLGIVPLGEMGWGIIGYTLLAGVVLLTYLPEHFLGRYR
jgi:hypothetical protein